MQRAIAMCRGVLFLIAGVLFVQQIQILLSYDAADPQRPSGMVLPLVAVAVYLMIYSWTAVFDRALFKLSRVGFWAIIALAASTLFGMYMVFFGGEPSQSRIHLNAPVNAVLALVFFFFGLLSVFGDSHVRWMRNLTPRTKR